MQLGTASSLHCNAASLLQEQPEGTCSNCLLILSIKDTSHLGTLAWLWHFKEDLLPAISRAVVWVEKLESPPFLMVGVMFGFVYLQVISPHRCSSVAEGLENGFMVILASCFISLE